jgi:hypothetical protein
METSASASWEDEPLSSSRKDVISSNDVETSCMDEEDTGTASDKNVYESDFIPMADDDEEVDEPTYSPPETLSKETDNASAESQLEEGQFHECWKPHQLT